MKLKALNRLGFLGQHTKVGDVLTEMEAKLKRMEALVIQPPIQAIVLKTSTMGQVTRGYYIDCNGTKYDIEITDESGSIDILG